MRWLSASLASAVAAGDLGIAMTGAGSWFGQAFLALLDAEGAIGAQTSIRLFGQSSRTTAFGGRTFPVEALATAAPLSSGPWLLLHFAFLGKEHTASLSASAFVAANDAILSHVQRITEPARDVRLIFTSSGAVYDSLRRLTPDRDANPYGWCKVAHERALTDLCVARNIPIVIPRVFNIGGPFANKVESYALSSFILAAQRTGVIGIAATRPTFRSYVHVNELLGVLCDAALAQPSGPPFIFDTEGSEAVEMGDLALAVANELSPLSIRVERAVSVSAEPDRYVGDGAIYRALLHRHGRTIAPLDAIIRDTARGVGTRTAA